MPRAGLDAQVVALAAADLADEFGLDKLTLSQVAERFGVRTPSLYKHIGGHEDLTRRITLLALTELGDQLRDSLQGLAGRDALAAAAYTFRAYATEHPGRYAATVRLDPKDPDERLVQAGTRVMASLSAVLAGYDVRPADEVHVLRTMRSLLHGFATLETAGGFQMETNVEESFAWLVDFMDGGLRSRSR